MPIVPVLLLHICSAVVGLLSGALAMFLRKGSGRHGAAGTVFSVSMLSMSASGAYIALFLRPNAFKVVVASLTFYLVSTSWWTAKRREARTSLFDAGAFLFVLAVGAGGIVSGVEAANSPTGIKDKVPAALYFVFGTAALLFASGDVRMFVRGGVSGSRRIARHLLRMCFALLIATISLYPGQGRLFPAWLRDTHFLFVPHILLIGAMIFWLVRVRRRATSSPRTAITSQVMAPDPQPV